MSKKRLSVALADLLSGDATIDDAGNVTVTTTDGQPILTFINGGGPNAWPLGILRIVKDNDVIPNGYGAAFESSDGSFVNFFSHATYGAQLWGVRDVNWTHYWGIGQISINGRLMFDGTEAVEFTLPPYVGTHAIFHAGANMVAAQADSTASDVATLKADFNALLAKMRAAGIMDP